MLSRVDEDWYQAVREFNVEKFIPEHQLDIFSEYLYNRVESYSDDIIVRFLMEEWKDGGVVLAYVWVLWSLDHEGGICDIEVMLPENNESMLAIPDEVGLFFASESPIYFNHGETASLAE